MERDTGERKEDKEQGWGEFFMQKIIGFHASYWNHFPFFRYPVLYMLTTIKNSIFLFGMIKFLPPGLQSFETGLSSGLFISLTGMFMPNLASKQTFQILKIFMITLSLNSFHWIILILLESYSHVYWSPWVRKIPDTFFSYICIYK